MLEERNQTGEELLLALGEQVICIDDVSLHCGSSFNASQLSSTEVEITLETQREREYN